MVRWFLPAVALLAVAVLFGCRADEAKISVTDSNAADFIKAFNEHKGKVVVVDCWATWCAPCVKKFPHLVEMHKKYADKGLVCISLSMDKYGDPDEYKQEKVLKFLKDKKAEFPNFILADPKKDEADYQKLLGNFDAIPYMVVFDRAGKKVWSSDQKPKLEDAQLEKLIEDELAKKP